MSPPCSITKPSEYGQPVLFSHPHLIQQNEVTPGIQSSDYEQRRRNLMDLLPDKSLAVSVSAPMKYIYKYRQASDFWYLTGFEEPDSAVILEKNSSSRGYKMTLFCSGKDLAKEKWDGASTSLSSAKTLFRADDTMLIDNFGSHLKSLLPTSSHVYVDLPNPIPKAARKKPKSLLKYLAGPSETEHDNLIESISGSMRRPLSPQMGKLRSIKSKAEQSAMRAAADMSARAHAKTMRFAQPGLSEGALAAHFEYLCSLGGAQRLAYVPVVASGPNSLILHYTANNQLIAPDELILMDAGCEYNGYASDITRTFPASGTFSPPQRELYSAVLSAQKQIVTLCSAQHGLSLQELHRKSCVLLKDELNQIGFNLRNEGDLERVLYPHYLSHPIGIGKAAFIRSIKFPLTPPALDLHESAHIDRSAPLKEDMVITIEPGIYVPPTANFPKHFHNIGVRIEDEVLVGAEHPVVLSVSAPKEIVDIEGACQGLLGLEPY
ncbi:hypothetical protein GALMADRAFT_227592 [Galerina marginata CBS 339.88]|uniref:Aminopeptidase P N-terminal domain-containing protein n=1 Tax=Galerina marginata (strain CBS 339.88) TaxID=685588 RepID=A0A067SUI2_GALM3|nr:hypothetical protein GALMADRAFT_227592 [Galerina marginata CBS 339.88]